MDLPRRLRLALLLILALPHVACTSSSSDGVPLRAGTADAELQEFARGAQADDKYRASRIRALLHRCGVQSAADDDEACNHDDVDVLRALSQSRPISLRAG